MAAHPQQVKIKADKSAAAPLQISNITQHQKSASSVGSEGATGSFMGGEEPVGLNDAFSSSASNLRGTAVLSDLAAT